jgi:hypothetical protein
MRQLVFLPVTIFALTAVCTAMICVIIEVRERRRMGRLAQGVLATEARRVAGPRLIFSSVSLQTKDEIGTGSSPMPSVVKMIECDAIHTAKAGLR